MPSLNASEDPPGASTVRPQDDRFWTLVYAIYMMLMDTPEADRERVIQEQCRGNAMLEKAVRDTIEGDRETIGPIFEHFGEDAFLPTPKDDERLYTEINGEYLILKHLGGGGQGDVYWARQKSLNRNVALKFIKAKYLGSSHHVELFKQEARTIAGLTHPHICIIHAIADEEEGPFMVMEYLDGDTLADAIDKKGPFTPEEALDIILDVCTGLARAHQARIVHRDIKPANIMRGSNGEIKVMDFGLAQLRKDGDSGGGGTRTYMSPEQWRGDQVSYQADIWAIGLVLLEMLTGAHPFKENSALPSGFDASVKNLDEPLPISVDTSRIHPKLWAVIKRCLQKRPRDRYGAIDELVDDLKAARKALGWPERRNRLVFAAGVLLLVLGGVFIWPYVKPISTPGLTHAGEGSSTDGGGSLAEVIEGMTGVLVLDQGLNTDEDLQRDMGWIVHQLDRFFGEINPEGISYVSSDELKGVKSASHARQSYPFDHLFFVKGFATGASREIDLQLIDAEKQVLQNQVPLLVEGSFEEKLSNILDAVTRLLGIEMTEDEKSFHIYGKNTTVEVRDLFKRATTAIEQVEDVDDLDIPIALLNEAEREDSSFALVHVALSELYQWRALDRPAEYGDEIELFEQHAMKASELDSQNLLKRWWSITQAYLLASEGNYEAAIRTLELAVLRDPGNLDVVLALAEAYRNDYRFDDARQVLLDSDTTDFDVLHELGRTAYVQGDYKEARRRFLAILDQEPNDVASLRNVGATYQMEGYFGGGVSFYDQAREYYDSALAVTDDPVAYLNRGTLNHNNASLVKTEGDSLKAIDMYRAAVNDYQQALQFHETYLLYSYIATAYEEIPDKVEEARAMYEKAIDLGAAYLEYQPDDEYALVFVGSAYLEVGRLDEARVLLEKANSISDLDNSLINTLNDALEDLADRSGSSQSTNH